MRWSCVPPTDSMPLTVAMYTSPLGASAGYIPCPVEPEVGMLTGNVQLMPPLSEWVATFRSPNPPKLVQPMWMRPKNGLVGELSIAIISLSSPKPE